MNKQKIIIIVLFVCLFFGGLFWLNQKEDVPVAEKKEIKAQQEKKSDTVKNEELISYEIPELGIKFPVKKEVKDNLIYKYGKHESNRGGSAYFSLKSIVNNGKFCDVNDAPLGVLARINGQYKKGVPGNSCKPSAFLKQFDTFFVCYFGPQADDGCFGDLTKTDGLNIRDYIGLDGVDKL